MGYTRCSCGFQPVSIVDSVRHSMECSGGVN